MKSSDQLPGINEYEQTSNHEEMSLGTMIATGISCGILVCVFFTFCSERWDYYITKKIMRRERTVHQFLHNDERSSDLSGHINEWESGSDDSSDDESNIRVSFTLPNCVS